MAVLMTGMRRIMWMRYLDFVQNCSFFQKLKGVMKGKGGAGAVAMGKALISNFTPGGFPFVSIFFVQYSINVYLEDINRYILFENNFDMILTDI